MSFLAIPASRKSRYKIIPLFPNSPWAAVGNQVGLQKALHHPSTATQVLLNPLAAGGVLGPCLRTLTWEGPWRAVQGHWHWIPQMLLELLLFLFSFPLPLWHGERLCLNGYVTRLPYFFDAFILPLQGKKLL